MLRKGGELLVAINTGWARVGKGTLGKDYAIRHRDVEVDETGADYRAATKAALESGIIERGMPKAVVQSCLSSGAVDLRGLVDARSKILEREGGRDSLYEPDIAGLVSYVAQVPEVRSEIKAGLRRRIEEVRDAGGVQGC